MEVRSDTSGFEELMKLVDDQNDKDLIEIGKQAIRIAWEKRNTSGKKNYKNRTGNLHNAPGACVVRNHKIVWMEVMADAEHPDASSNTENILVYSEHPKDGLYLADGMRYASFVSSKGFDVLDSAILFADKYF